jgi:hypothetical protein
MNLWACLADAMVNHKYTVDYAIAPDITIRFEPPSVIRHSMPCHA